MNDEMTLLPCPFCGGEAETLTAESMYGGYLFGIMCNDCRSRGDVYDTEAEAIAAWNNRTPIEYEDWFYLPKTKDEIVRCRDCAYSIHFLHHDDERWQCAEPHQAGDDVKPDAYCWRGKRKDGGDD